MKSLLETLQVHKKDIQNLAERFQFKNIYLFVDIDDEDNNKIGTENNKSPSTTSLYLVVDVDNGENPHNATLLAAKIIELLGIDAQVIIKRHITNSVRLEYITSRCIPIDNDIEKIKEWLDEKLKEWFINKQITDIYFKDSTISKKRLERTLDLAEKTLKRGRQIGNKYSLYQPHENEPPKLTEEMIELCMDPTKKDQASELMLTLSPLQLQELTEELISRRSKIDENTKKSKP